MSYFHGCQRMVPQWHEGGIVTLSTAPGTCAITCMSGWSLGCACYQSLCSRCSRICILVVNMLKPMDYIFIALTPTIVR